MVRPQRTVKTWGPPDRLGAPAVRPGPAAPPHIYRGGKRRSGIVVPGGDGGALPTFVLRLGCIRPGWSRRLMILLITWPGHSELPLF